MSSLEYIKFGAVLEVLISIYEKEGMEKLTSDLKDLREYVEKEYRKND